MRKMILLIVAFPLAAILFLGAPRPGIYEHVTVNVENESNACAWITVYYGRIYLPWIIATGSARPGYLKPGENREFDVKMPNPLPIHTAEIKVRAQFESDAHCTKPTIDDKSAENKNIQLGSEGHATVTSKVEGTKGHYSVTRPS